LVVSGIFRIFVVQNNPMITHNLIDTYEARGHFTQEEIDRYLVNPGPEVREMILGSTDTGFRKACLLAIIDNSDASIPFLRGTEFREDLQTLLMETRQQAALEKALRGPRSCRHRAGSDGEDAPTIRIR
jgi:hypothetical protein